MVVAQGRNLSITNNVAIVTEGGVEAVMGVEDWLVTQEYESYDYMNLSGESGRCLGRRSIKMELVLSSIEYREANTAPEPETESVPVKETGLLVADATTIELLKEVHKRAKEENDQRDLSGS